jgi:DNA polymerase-3 subunit beta
MIFSLNKKDIADKLASLNSIIPSKSNLMVLGNFRLEADSTANLLTIIATDLNITTIVKVPANVVEGGTLLVPANKLSEIVNSMPDASINFTVKDNHFILECEKTKVNLSFMDSSMFPEINVINVENEYTVDAENLKKLIQNSVFCANTDASYTICNGVFLRIEDKMLTIAATDTKRIGEAKWKGDISLDIPYEIVLPKNALDFLNKIIHNDVDTVVVKFDENRISFAVENTLLITNKFEGRYPTYTVAFRNQPNHKLVIDKNKLKDAVRRVSLLSEDDDKLIKLNLSQEEVLVESIISERGNARESISGFSYDGPDCFFCLNAKFLTGFMNVIETDEAVILFRSTEEPIWLLNNAEFEHLEIRFILMPMRINR